MTEKQIGKIEVLQQNVAKNGNSYLKLTITAKGGEHHTYTLFDSARLALEAKGLEEGNWVEFSETVDEKGYKQLKTIQLTDPSDEEISAVLRKSDEATERIARTSALRMAVDIYNAGNIPASQLYETAEEFKAYILTGKIPDEEVVE